jgi:aconitate hydratase
MLAAALLARNAVRRGLRVPPYVKTSLAPGSKVVTEYLRQAGLLPELEALGFAVVGYGCTTCIGNSGPLPPEVSRGIAEGSLVAAAVLSGNRNFEGRINPDVRANYLASPPLVVAYALAGTTDVDLAHEPIGTGADGTPVRLADLWPSQAEVRGLEARIGAEMFRSTYANVFDGNPTWNAISVPAGDLFAFRDDSTYIQEPPFFQGLTLEPAAPSDIVGARVLAVLGDSVTTDHISPAGDIALASPAGRYLQSRGLEKKDFNSYGSRRGNDRVMVRGTFANIRLKNAMVPGVEGGVTIHVPSSERMDIYDAAERYKAEGTPLVVLAGKEYGSGSSRDWAAKGTLLLGVRAVIAESYERIHRSNLVGMGVLPLQFHSGESAEGHGLSGRETLTIRGLAAGLSPRQDLSVELVRGDGTRTEFRVTARLDTPVEIGYFRNGGILQAVLRKMLRD